MDKSIYLFFLSFLFTLSAHSAYAIKNERGEIVLKGSTCQELQQEVQALLEWSYKLKNKINPVALKCRETSFLGISWGQEINISQVIPPLLSQYLEVKPKAEGPNCWNSTIVVSKISPYLRYSSDLEFHFWLNSPLCRLKGEHEERRPGDIIAIQKKNGTEWNEYHGFTYISDHLSFTKNGFQTKNPYQLVATQDVLNEYQVPRNCRFPPHHKDCQTKANFYSCMSFEQYFALTPVREDIIDSYSAIDNLECLTQQMSFEGVQKPIQKFVFLHLNILENFLWGLQKDTNSISDKEMFLIHALEFKIRSLRTQLLILNK